jgi:hypothetical protein
VPIDTTRGSSLKATVLRGSLYSVSTTERTTDENPKFKSCLARHTVNRLDAIIRRFI